MVTITKSAFNGACVISETDVSLLNLKIPSQLVEVMGKMLVNQMQPESRLQFLVEMILSKVEMEEKFTFRTKSRIMVDDDNFGEVMRELFTELDIKVDNFLKLGSGWLINKLITFKIQKCKYTQPQVQKY